MCGTAPALRPNAKPTHSRLTLTAAVSVPVRGRADNRESVRGTPPCTNGTWFGIGVRKLKFQTGNREFVRKRG
jgi:hypothetical protein